MRQMDGLAEKGIGCSKGKVGKRRGSEKGSVTIFFSRPDDEKQVVCQECVRGVVTEGSKEAELG
jgi:hypothetical protein